MLAVSMPNLLTSSALVETATKCLATAALGVAAGARPIAQTIQTPRAGRLSVGHRFERRERLGRDDEQSLGRIEVARGFGEVGAVDIGDEPKR